MAEKRDNSVNPGDREMLVTRLFDAPRDLVFEAWIEPRHIAAWWGPNGFTTTIHEMDVRPGGVWRFIMHGPDGTDYPNKIVYREVVRPERLVYHHGSGDDDAPGQFDVTVTFAEERGKTRVTMRALFATAEERNMIVEKHNAIEGAHQTLQRLADLLAKRSSAAQ